MILGRLARRQLTTALQRALAIRQPAPGLIVHADRGSQHTSATCCAYVAQARSSYARVGSP